MTDNTRDYTGRRLGVPVYSLLGGKVRDKVAVYAWIGGDRPKDVEEQALVPTLLQLGHWLSHPISPVFQPRGLTFFVNIHYDMIV